MSGVAAPVRPGAATPVILTRFMAAIVALAVLAGLVALWTAGGARDAARTIGRDAEPSVALALRMEATLSDMNAAALADALTGSGEAAGASRQFRDDLSSIASDIVEASRNITYGEAEAEPLRRLRRMLALYEEAVVEARWAGQGDRWFTSRRLQWAGRVDEGFAIPAATALADANAAELEARYAGYRAGSLGRGGAALGAFALLALAQLAAQAWLARRMRRVVNPLLAAATLATVAAGLWFGAAVLREREDLRAAKSDAYDSLHVLFQAKSAAEALRADMSLWLLDAEARQGADARMDAAARALIAAEPDRKLLDALHAASETERRGDPAAALAQAPHPGGLLGTELDNVTFGAPERDAATASVARLADAEAVVAEVKAAHGRDRVLAVARWLDDRPGGGAAAFAALQAALDRTIEVNQAEFDRRVAASLRRAALMPAVAGGGLLLAALLSAGGLWLRLRDALMGTTLEEADAELARWRDRLAAASRNVSELSELPDYAAARRAASGEGRAAEESRKLAATMDELWQGVLLIGAALDRAAQARAAGSRLWGGEEAGRRALDILRGPSISVDLADTPVLHRRLLAGPRATATVSPETLLETMDAAFDRARGRLARVTEASGRADALHAALAAAIGRLPAPEALATRLDAAAAPDPLDRLDALEALRPDVEAASAADGRASAALAAARADLAALQDAAGRAASAAAECRAAVDATLSDVDETAVRELAAWLDRVGRTRDAGRAEACALGLANWRTQHDGIAAEVRATAAAAASALARRDDLRARFGALRAKRRARGADAGLDALEAAARAPIDAAPMDLPAASAAVAAFHAALARS